MSRSVRKDIHSLRGSSDGTAVASIQEVDLERASSLIQNGYAPVIAPALVYMAKEKQAGLGVADSFLLSSSTLGCCFYNAIYDAPVTTPLPRAVHPACAHMAIKGIICPPGRQGPWQLWGWLRLRLHLFGQNKMTLSNCVSNKKRTRNKNRFHV